MGSGIAQTALATGFEVVLMDLDADAVARARADIYSRLARLVEKGRLAEDFVAGAKQRLSITESINSFDACSVVIEAIVERLEPKQELFAALESVVSDDTLLATNTSSISVAAIASRCQKKSRICGLHFFNPVPLMQLVEVIVAPSTSEDSALAAIELSRELGKTPVRVKDGPGFLVNLAGRAYVTEALQVVQEGVADMQTIDRIMRDAVGFRMGPFQLMDLTGIDVNFPATRTIYAGYQHDPRLKTSTLHELMFNAGRYGQKTGQGFHEYSDAASDTDAGLPVWESAQSLEVAMPLPAPSLSQLVAECGLSETEGGGQEKINLVAPIGEDTTSVCVRLNLDPAKTVAIDLTAIENRHLTLMSAPGGADAVVQVGSLLHSRGFRVEIIKDSPGFVLQRVLAMIANLGCELAQIGVGSPEDIDTAMKLAQNYPKGPLEWAESLGLETVHSILTALQQITGSDRYRPSLWLRRRAMLDLPVRTRD